MASHAGAEERAITRPPRLDEPVQCPQRQRNELRLLQLQMRVVIHPVGQKREDDPRHDRRATLPRERVDEEHSAQARQRKP